jgi:FecR protein
MRIKTKVLCAALLAAASLLARQAFAFDGDASWQVTKSSGEVFISSAESPQPVSLTNAAAVRPGDTIRTGENGMLLLTRGEESLLVSPNSVIDIPKENLDGMSTTIMERAGSVLVKAEKRNVKHFEVVTPYLAAVVKGTNFRVSVDRASSNVEVIEGQVDVGGFRSGEQILLLPGQTAKVAATGSGSLSTSGSGLFNPVRVGPPRTSPVQPELPKVKFAAADQAAAPMAAAPRKDEARPRTANVEPVFSEEKKGTPERMDLMTVGVPVTIGMVVTLAVVVGRGRKNKKRADKPRRWQP